MPVLMFVLWLALALVQFAAFADGMRHWFDAGALAFGLTFAVCMILGPIGGLVMAVVGFHGATSVWGWEWWQALLLVAPALVFQVLATGLGGVVSLASTVLGGRRSS